jgi:hypothetical protein
MKRVIAGMVLVLGAVSCKLALNSDARVLSAKSGTFEAESAQARPASTKVHEDDEVKIPIPAGWMIATGDHPAVAINDAKGQLLLSRTNYTLALAYDTQQVSGIIGGRFIEIFTIPWLGADEAWDCSLHLSSSPQPASRALMFLNVIFRTDDPEVRGKCGIQKALGYWTNKGGAKQTVGEQRWFGGFFTTAGGGRFFQSVGTGCGQKAYTLTSKAKTPDELPLPDDQDLRKTIAEAIDIVNSIHYKRCPPTSEQ